MKIRHEIFKYENIQKQNKLSMGIPSCTTNKMKHAYRVWIQHPFIYNHSTQSSKHSSSQPYYIFLNQPSAAIQLITKCTLKYLRYILLDYFKLYQIVYSNHLKASKYQSQKHLRSFFIIKKCITFQCKHYSILKYF